MIEQRTGRPQEQRRQRADSVGLSPDVRHRPQLCIASRVRLGYRSAVLIAAITFARDAEKVFIMHVATAMIDPRLPAVPCPLRAAMGVEEGR